MFDEGYLLNNVLLIMFYERCVKELEMKEMYL